MQIRWADLRAHKWVVTACLTWGLLLVIGFGLWSQYEAKPGLQGSVPKQWPGASPIQLSQGRPTLLIFLHPHCPGSRASMAELTRMLTRLHGKMAMYALFLSPTDQPIEWTHTDLWYSASQLPGVTVIDDKNGQFAHLFHATISGQVLVYDSGGLEFNGGITPARGHQGDNDGEQFIKTLIVHLVTQAATTPAFGCRLLSNSGGHNI